MDQTKIPYPMNEEYRLAVLERLAILDTPPEETFDRLTRLATQQFGTPIALVSLIDRKRQWFKSCAGVDISETDREVALCAYTIMSDQALIVLDTTKDLRFADNPLVASPPHVRFYAGAPLTTKEGIRVGTFCLIDLKPRDVFGSDQIKILEEFAALTMEAMEVRQELASAISREEDGEATPQTEFSKHAEKAKRQFLAVVGHELRTPLNAILGFGSMLRQENDAAVGPQAQLEYIDAIISSGKRLLSTVDAVLSYSQAERGELDIHEEEIELLGLIETCVVACSSEALAKNINFQLSESNSSLPALRADRIQTEQMLLQIISNAVAFTEDGKTVAIRAETDSDGGIVLFIDDAGPGIGDHQVEQAMEIFRQLSEGLNRSKEGLGIGLPLTKLLIEMHGGSLSVRQSKSGGTTAELRFPPYRTAAQGSQIQFARAS